MNKAIGSTGSRVCQWVLGGSNHLLKFYKKKMGKEKGFRVWMIWQTSRERGGRKRIHLLMRVSTRESSNFSQGV